MATVGNRGTKSIDNCRSSIKPIPLYETNLPVLKKGPLSKHWGLNSQFSLKVKLVAIFQKRPQFTLIIFGTFSRVCSAIEESASDCKVFRDQKECTIRTGKPCIVFFSFATSAGNYSIVMRHLAIASTTIHSVTDMIKHICTFLNIFM